jgi:hypothetical protein
MAELLKPLKIRVSAFCVLLHNFSWSKFEYYFLKWSLPFRVFHLAIAHGVSPSFTAPLILGHVPWHLESELDAILQNNKPVLSLEAQTTRPAVLSQCIPTHGHNARILDLGGRFVQRQPRV